MQYRLTEAINEGKKIYLQNGKIDQSLILDLRIYPKKEGVNSLQKKVDDARKMISKDYA